MGRDSLHGNLGLQLRDEASSQHPGQEVAWGVNTLTLLSSSSNLGSCSPLTKFIQGKRKPIDTSHTGRPFRAQSLVESGSGGQTSAHLLHDKQNTLHCLLNKHSLLQEHHASGRKWDSLITTKLLLNLGATICRDTQI